MKKMEKLLSEIERYIPQYKEKNPNVSQASVGWQLEHCLLVINSIIRTIEASNPEDYNYKWNLNCTIIMTIGKIPRGKAKAPSRVQPIQEFNEVTLSSHLSETRLNLKKLEQLNKNQFFSHPYFGHMKLNAAIKFLGIHTKHHLKIVADILN